jgi:thymidine kinase
MIIPVIVYGLKNDFQNNLFDGSEALLIYADKIEEIKTICWFCNKKATMVLRIIEGEPVYTGEQIHIGDSRKLHTSMQKMLRQPSVDKDS